MPMNAELAEWWKTACFAGAAGIALGAFGAHGLKNSVTDPKLLKTWETAAHYHMLAVVGLFAVVLCPVFSGLAARCFFYGMLLFSGSLYALVLSGVRQLGAITPIGGLLLIGGFVSLGLVNSW